MRQPFRLASLLLFVATPAFANLETHDVAWYVAHPFERQQTLRLCHSNAAYVRTAACGNVEAAAAAVNAPPMPDFAAMLADPSYWRANPIAGAGLLARCRQGLEPNHAWCAAAANASLQDMRH